MCGCLPTSESPSSECDASSKNSSERLCAARALTAISGPLTAMRSACGMARASNSPFSFTPCHWLSLSSETTFDMAWIRPIRSSRATSMSEPWRSVRVTIDWITARMFLTRWLSSSMTAVNRRSKPIRTWISRLSRKLL